MYSNFMFLDRFLFELSCKNTHKRTQTRTHTETLTSTLVALLKNATIIKPLLPQQFLKSQKSCKTLILQSNVRGKIHVILEEPIEPSL